MNQGFKLGAQDWNRTSTSLRMADFESAASTNSATWAFPFLKGWQYYVFPAICPKSSKVILFFFLKTGIITSSTVVNLYDAINVSCSPDIVNCQKRKM